MSSRQQKEQRLEDAKNLDFEPLDGKDAKWICLKRIRYLDAAGRVRVWESAERTTRPKSSGLDSIAVVAILEIADGPEIVLQRQFRPPVGKVCIEIPAGLVDEGETAQQAAIRELREETGYVGDVIHHPGDDSVEGEEARGIMYADPGLSNTNTKLIHVKIDLGREENKNLKPELEDNEFIETFTVKLDMFYKELRKMEAQGYGIDARVATLAEGFELRRRFFC